MRPPLYPPPGEPPDPKMLLLVTASVMAGLGYALIAFAMKASM